MKTMEHGAEAKFHGDNSMFSMLAWDRKIVRVPHMKAWDIKTIESMGSTGIYKNESMESMGAWYFLVYYFQ